MPSGIKQPKPPPDYFSRRVQFRLLLAVGSLLLVISLMFEARKAENWEWMWYGQSTVEGVPEEFDTRLPPVDTGDPIGTVYASSEGDTAAVIQQASTDRQQDALHRLELDVWKKLLARLKRPQRMALDQLLQAARREDPQTADVGPKSEAVEVESDGLVETISQTYTTYLDDANEAVILSGDGLADAQKESLLNALRELEIGWTQDLLPALQARAESRPWTPRDRARLQKLQALLDELAVSAIRDDSFWRPAEQDAWFRWFEILQQTDPAQLGRQSTAEVGFLQLFKQSDEYRGKLVTIRGSARLAYRVSAPRNIHGITNYVVYWIKPAGGPNSPIVVYALETPPGFPPVKDKDLEGTTELNEEVSFTGYFFKRWAYPGQNGLQTAPLLLARGPTWVADPAGRRDRGLPDWSVIVASVGGMLLLSVGLAVLAYRAGKTPVGEGTSLRKADQAELAALAQQPVLPRPEEALRKLAATDKKEPRE